MATASANAANSPGAPAVPAVIDHVFQIELNRFIAGKSHGFSIDPDWKEIIGQQGINEIAERFGKFIKSAVRVHQVGGQITINPDVALKSTSSKGESSSGGSKSDKIPRPPNAFILYRQHLHPSVKADHPDYENNKISQVIGANWRSESAEVKDYFSNLAKFIKDKHAETFPGYTYQPRKPAEKKRRMTAKKAAKLDALSQALTAKDNKDDLNMAQNGVQDGVQNTVDVGFATTPTVPTTTTSTEVSSMQNIDNAELSAVQNPHPAMTYGEFGDNKDMLPQFTFGDTAFSPENLEAMIESHNKQFDEDVQPNYTTGLGEYNIVTTFGNEPWVSEADAVAATINWKGFSTTMEELEIEMNKEYQELFVDPNDVASGLKYINDRKHDFADSGAEFLRQEDLLQPFMLDS